MKKWMDIVNKPAEPEPFEKKEEEADAGLADDAPSTSADIT